MTEVYPPLEFRQKWLDFRRENNPAAHRALTVQATSLRDVIIRALWDSECSYEQASAAIHAAVDQLIRDGAWGPGRDPA